MNFALTHTDAIEQMAQHAGACEAILQAARLLRLRGHREAADLLIENTERLTEFAQTGRRAA